MADTSRNVQSTELLNRFQRVLRHFPLCAWLADAAHVPMRHPDSVRLLQEAKRRIRRVRSALNRVMVVCDAFLSAHRSRLAASHSLRTAPQRMNQCSCDQSLMLTTRCSSLDLPVLT